MGDNWSRWWGLVSIKKEADHYSGDWKEIKNFENWKRTFWENFDLSRKQKQKQKQKISQIKKKYVLLPTSLDGAFLLRLAIKSSYAFICTCIPCYCAILLLSSDSHLILLFSLQKYKSPHLLVKSESIPWIRFKTYNISIDIQPIHQLPPPLCFFFRFAQIQKFDCFNE